MTKQTVAPSKSEPKVNRSTILWVIGGVVALALIVLMALSIANEPAIDTSIGFGEVTAEGNPIPFLAEGGDPTIGFPAPTVSGADWNGVPTTIEADGRPKLIVFLAHWCPHCQAEVPEVQAWLDAGNLPDDVDIYSVTALTNPTRTNWPPQDWLEAEGWTVPVIMDDAESTVATAYGMTGTPFWVVLDGENNNLGRVSGQVGVTGLETMVRVAQDSITDSGS
ncbi:MAG: TlpA disulfide reductase family protein [Acidimicrobiia bacterium]